MDKFYMCLCERQEFLIQDSTIKCTGCKRLYTLIVVDNKLESPGNFNERIRKGEWSKLNRSPFINQEADRRLK